MTPLSRLWLLSVLALTLLLPTAAAAMMTRPGAAPAPALADPVRTFNQELTTKHPQTVALDTPRRAKNAPLPTSETRAYLVHNKTGWLVVVVNRPEKGSTQLIAARWYDPQTGRFISRDPIEPAVGELEYNPYAYCENSPLNKVDRTGAIIAPEDYKNRSYAQNAQALFLLPQNPVGFPATQRPFRLL